MKNLHILIIFILLGLVVNLEACAPTLGPAFSRVEIIPEKEGLVYIYRPNNFLGGAVYYDVKANGTPVTTLYKGGYYAYFAKTGEIEFQAKTEATSSITVDIKQGQTYYLRGTVGMGFLVGHPHLEIVPQDIGEKEVAECKLLPVYKEEKETINK